MKACPLIKLEKDKLRTSYLLPLTSYLCLGFRLEVIGNRFRQFALSAQIFMEIDDTDGKCLGLCQHHRVGHTHLLSQENDKLRTSYLLPLTFYLCLGNSEEFL